MAPQGLTLVTSMESGTGFKGVSQERNGMFTARGKAENLGSFGSAEEAAENYARAEAAAAARRHAEAEGLILVSSKKNPSGFKHVNAKTDGCFHAYLIKSSMRGASENLGAVPTDEQGARPEGTGERRAGR